MQVIQYISEMQHIVMQLNREAKSIGFVPTMGFLHSGHESLLQQAKQQNQISILSIFVNPTQFNQSDDFEKYPVNIENDLKIAEKNQIDYVFMPNQGELYADQYRYQLQENKHSVVLEGQHRPGHFTGVLTVVLKLLNIIRPQKLYLGKKDYQQYKLIHDMVEALFLPIEVIACEIIREADGLAMSSRNVRLTGAERAQAPALYQVIQASQSAEEAQKKLITKNFKVDYVIDLDNRRYVAAWLGQTRLIDNVEL